MREKYSTLALALLLCLCLALPSGCGKGKAAPPPRPRGENREAPGGGAQAVPMAAAEAPASASTPAEKPRAEAMEPAAGQPGPAPSPFAPDTQGRPEAEGRPAGLNPAVLPPQIANSRAFGLMGTAGPIIPEDLGIGSLQDYRPKDKVQLAAMDCARSFLDGIAAGEMATARVDPAKADLVGLLAEEVLAPPHPKSYRLGAIEPGIAGSPRDIVVRFRLEYEGRGKEGELGLRFRQGSWYVESLSFTGEKWP